ncbi:hypothetical protein CVT24_007065 [Panaeolus cyanescens]|uniref:Uncharacterized protein n=1 Tax=Panaeolus cyanescens TaxID=181874 RepID=A0A409VJX7_9AGAR|nr:hypothetical protein CVT24_007065 [Panaeolus cyanescens]
MDTLIQVPHESSLSENISQFTSSFVFPEAGRHTHVLVTRGAESKVYVVKASCRGRFIALGYDGGTLDIVQSTGTNPILKRIDIGQHTIRALAWHTKEEDTIFVGTGAGEVIRIRLDLDGRPNYVHRQFVGGNVTSMNVSKNSDKLVLAMGRSVVIIDKPLLVDALGNHLENKTFHLHPDLPAEDPSTLTSPMMTQFLDDDWVVAGYMGSFGLWLIPSRGSKRQIEPRVPGTIYAGSALSPSGKTMAIYKATGGLDWYSLPAGRWYGSVPGDSIIAEQLRVHSVSQLVQIAFVNEHIVMAGSVKGVVTFWKETEPLPIKTVRIASEHSIIPTVSVFKLNLMTFGLAVIQYNRTSNTLPTLVCLKINNILEDTTSEAPSNSARIPLPQAWSSPNIAVPHAANGQPTSLISPPVLMDAVQIHSERPAPIIPPSPAIPESVTPTAPLMQSDMPRTPPLPASTLRETAFTPQTRDSVGDQRPTVVSQAPPTLIPVQEDIAAPTNQQTPSSTRHVPASGTPHIEDPAPVQPLPHQVLEPVEVGRRRGGRLSDLTTFQPEFRAIKEEDGTQEALVMTMFDSPANPFTSSSRIQSAAQTAGEPSRAWDDVDVDQLGDRLPRPMSPLSGIQTPSERSKGKRRVGWHMDIPIGSSGQQIAGPSTPSAPGSYPRTPETRTRQEVKEEETDSDTDNEDVPADARRENKGKVGHGAMLVDLFWTLLVLLYEVVRWGLSLLVLNLIPRILNLVFWCAAIVGVVSVALVYFLGYHRLNAAGDALFKAEYGWFLDVKRDITRFVMQATDQSCEDPCLCNGRSIQLCTVTFPSSPQMESSEVSRVPSMITTLPASLTQALTSQEKTDLHDGEMKTGDVSLVDKEYTLVTKADDGIMRKDVVVVSTDPGSPQTTQA